MVFFDLRPLADPAQLNERVSGVGLVLGAHDLVLIGRRQDADLDELRVRQEIQGDEVGPRFFERRELLLQQRLPDCP